MRLVQWKWIRMRITTQQYIDELKKLEGVAREVYDIFGQIRLDSAEGQMAVKAREDLRQIQQLSQQLSRQSMALRMSPSAESSASSISEDNSEEDALSSRKMLRNKADRRSICI